MTSSLLVLCACGVDYETEVIGTWKNVNHERYLTIEKTPDTESGMRAVIYVPNKRAEQAHAPSVMNHLSMPASMENGILMIKVEAGEIPVLYDPNNKLVVLNGTQAYQKVPEHVAQLKLGFPQATDATGSEHADSVMDGSPEKRAANH